MPTNTFTKMPKKVRNYYLTFHVGRTAAAALTMLAIME